MNIQIAILAKRTSAIAAFALVAAGLLARSAGATSVPQQQLDFLGGAGGSLSYTLGIGNGLSIAGAPINILQALPAGVKLNVTSGTLTFMTAGCLTGCFANKLSGGGAMSSPTFAYGGTLTLKGAIPGTGIVTLLSGSFMPVANPQAGQAKPVPPSATLNSKTSKGGFDGSLLLNDINPAIYKDFLPLIFKAPASAGKGYLSELFIDLSFSAGSLSGHTFTSGRWSGSIKSSDLIVKPVPEPISLVLFGTVLLAAAAFLRRRSLKAA